MYGYDIRVKGRSNRIGYIGNLRIAPGRATSFSGNYNLYLAHVIIRLRVN